MNAWSIDWELVDILVHRVYFFFESGIIFYVFTINAIYFFLTVAAFFCIRRYHSVFTDDEKDLLMKSPLTPGVSLIVPSYNEAKTVRESVGGMLRLQYPNYEVIVVNDGSKDETLAILIEQFKLYRSARTVSGSLHTSQIRAVYESRDPIRLLVIDKENGGKADAINAGINAAQSPYVMVVDSDSLIEKDALFNMIKPCLEEPELTVAVGGTVRAVNDCDVAHGRVRRIRTSGSWLANFQAVEYLRAFFGGRVGFSVLNSLLIISGAFGLFRRDAVLAAGGFEESTIGEDMELIVRMHHYYRRNRLPYRIVYVAQPVCWTEVPDSLKILHRQRKRWQRGTVESLWRHREMLLHPKFGMVGLFAFTYFFLFEMLGPAVELLGYVLTALGLAFNIIAPEIAILFFSVSVMGGILLSTSAVLLEEFTKCRYPDWRDTWKLFAAAVLENFGFRQLLTWWRVQGLIDGLKGKRGGWGVMERRGFKVVAR
ncbi:MAG: glycosyltransferase family 2 protein [Bryobacterales bacterium]|nr:glycosyltransferase family 2 protein [Bryobacterales bacterium]